MKDLVGHLSGWMSDVDAAAIPREAADKFRGMVNFLKVSCEDVSMQMAFIERRVAEIKITRDLIREELQILTQSKPGGAPIAYSAIAVRVPPVKINNSTHETLRDASGSNIIIFNHPPPPSKGGNEEDKTSAKSC